MKKIYELSVTTQGPTYPPSEIMNEDGNFIVVGLINKINNKSDFIQEWGAALVSKNSSVPAFGMNKAYEIIKYYDLEALQATDDEILYTLPTPLPCNNYPGIFAPDQLPEANNLIQPSYPLHKAPIPDMRDFDGLKVTGPIYLSDWIKAQGEMEVSLTNDRKAAVFDFDFKHLVPNSMYTVMALRENDLNPANRSRPGPLGIPNVFITDSDGQGRYQATMPNPFESADAPNRNRIINVVLLYMSRQMSYGGAIGHHGLGGDIHAQLKLTKSSFWEFNTTQ